jgi:UDPglucose 6-dehydrogenase
MGIFLYHYLMTTPHTIGIIGMGTVGKATLSVFPHAIGYSPHEYAQNRGRIKKCDLVFICAPTPHVPEKGCDTSALEESFALLKKSAIVVIRSTVPPGTTERLQQYYPAHKLLFNPEFLSEATAIADTQSPFRQIIGYTKKSFPIAGEIRDLLPLAAFTRLMPATEAELVKYWSNTFYAAKVVFANQMYDLCQKLNIDYETVKECVRADARIGRWHLEIFNNLFSAARKDHRGYGGKCLPKDIKNLIHFANKKGVPLKLFQKVDALNEKLKNETPRSSLPRPERL